MKSTETLTIEELRKKLQENYEVNFSYVKKNGEIREARGTLNMNTIPFEKLPKDTSLNRSNFSYYDLDKNDWRSLSQDASTVELLK